MGEKKRRVVAQQTTPNKRETRNPFMALRRDVKTLQRTGELPIALPSNPYMVSKTKRGAA